MTAANSYGVVTEADVRAAQTAVDALVEVLTDQGTVTYVTTRVQLELRGILAGQLAETRAVGYLEGVQRGRREAAHVVLDALRGEGLAP